MILLSLALAWHQSTLLPPGANLRNVTMTAFPAQVRAGEVVHLTVEIRGPVRFPESCQAPNPQIWIIPPGGGRIVLTPASLCLSGADTVVPQDQSLTERLDWDTSGLAPGLYSVHGKLRGLAVALFSDENLPVVSVRVE